VTAPGIRDGNRAVLYIRVSTDEQSASIEAQREVCQRIATTRGYEIVGEFVDENVSGAIEIEKRPALKNALRALADERADRLIVAKLDRLARNVRVALEIDEDYATRHGWGIVFGDMDVDTSTAVGKMQLSMFASVARFERDRIAERTREALAVKRAQGVRLGRPSALPVAVVAHIVAERQAGSSLRTIADGLRRDGVPTAQGGQAWHASTVRKVLASRQAAAAVLQHVATQLGPNPLEGERMYGVWQTGEFFRKGAPPWAVAADRDALQGWATDNIPQDGSKHLCFAEKTGSQRDLADADWKLTGHLYKKHGVKMRNIKPERYERERANAIADSCRELTADEQARRTVNIDATQPDQRG
jgi:DNA invertase Pin-like site-specific DNA recombinase